MRIARVKWERVEMWDEDRLEVHTQQSSRGWDVKVNEMLIEVMRT
jgi:uncharacterized protein (UPF0335 family)